MQAMVINQFGGPEQLVLRDIPTPVPAEGEVLIKVKAFGINRAETQMRAGIWFPPVAPVSGIECVGQVEDDPSGKLATGQTVATIMGGMGRSRNGSYAEYSCVLSDFVFPLRTNLDWAELAAIPESYATAWQCLFDNVHMKPGQVLFVRGGTSALGQAAINIARAEGVTVLTSTRSESKVGASRVLLENDKLSEAVREQYPDGIDGVFELLGDTTMVDSLRMVRKDGYVCMAGFLAGQARFPLNGSPACPMASISIPLPASPLARKNFHQRPFLCKRSSIALPTEPIRPNQRECCRLSSFPRPIA